LAENVLSSTEAGAQQVYEAGK